jgi:hypothetical protein
VSAASLARWGLAAVIAGTAAAAFVDPAAMPWSGNERLSAVLLVDGQAYFGHVTDVPWSDTVELRDVYYFQDARASSMNLPLGLLRRGSELHQPADGMSFRRDKILAIERLAPSSPVRAAIAVERALSAAGR